MSEQYDRYLLYILFSFLCLDYVSAVVLYGPIENTSAFVREMAWYRERTRPLPDDWNVNIVCVTREGGRLGRFKNAYDLLNLRALKI